MGSDNADRESWRSDYEILWNLRKLYHTRRNTWNTIFLTANSVILAGLAIGSQLTSPGAEAAVSARAVALLVALAGGAICILWLFMNWRLDIQDDVRWEQLNVLEESLGKAPVSISRQPRDLFRESKEGDQQGDSTDADYSPLESRVTFRQKVPVRHVLVWLAVVFLAVHAVVALWASWPWPLVSIFLVFCPPAIGKVIARAFLLLVLWGLFALVVWVIGKRSKPPPGESEESENGKNLPSESQ